MDASARHVSKQACEEVKPRKPASNTHGHGLDGVRHDAEARVGEDDVGRPGVGRLQRDHVHQELRLEQRNDARLRRNTRPSTLEAVEIINAKASALTSMTVTVMKYQLRYERFCRKSRPDST